VRIEQDSSGRNHYWVYGGPQDPSPGPDTDIAAIRDGCVSITPITYRTTAIACMEALGDSGLAELLG
jgi:broad specificity polyphosphatase/5'/3'-nucleotidase SurE